MTPTVASPVPDHRRGPARVVVAAIAAFAVVCTVGVARAPGAAATVGPDPSFSGDGIAEVVLGPVGPLSGVVTAVQADGKVLAAGSAAGNTYVARLGVDGTPDPSFGTGGIAELTGDVWLADMAVDSVGHIVMLLNPGLDAPHLVRLDSSGARDVGWNGGNPVIAGVAGTTQSRGVDLTVLSGDRLAVAGFGGYLPYLEPSPTLAFVEANGQLGAEPSGLGDPSADGLLMLPGEGVLTAGAVGPGGSYQAAGARGAQPGGLAVASQFLLSVDNGNAATGPTTTGLDFFPVAATTDGAGRLVVAGGSDRFGRVARFSAGSHTLDATFGSSGVASIDLGAPRAAIRSIGVVADGSILGSAQLGVLAVTAVGDSAPADPAVEPQTVPIISPVSVFRLGADGALDTAVGSGGMFDTGLRTASLFPGLSSGASVVADGRIVVPGDLDGAERVLVCSPNCGTVDRLHVGRFDLRPADPPAPEPPPTTAPAPDTSSTCPTGPVVVTPENAYGAAIAWFVCRMRLVGTVWRGTPTLVLLPGDYFACPSPPQRRWWRADMEFGAFLLQAQCGYVPLIARAWFGPWFAWDPPR